MESSDTLISQPVSTSSTSRTISNPRSMDDNSQTSTMPKLRDTSAKRERPSAILKKDVLEAQSQNKQRTSKAGSPEIERVEQPPAPAPTHNTNTGAAPSSSSSSGPPSSNDQQKPLQDIDHNVVASLERSAEQLERQLLEIQAALQASEQVGPSQTKNLRKKTRKAQGRSGTELGFTTVEGATLAPAASGSGGTGKKRRGPKRKAGAKRIAGSSSGNASGVVDVDDVAIELEMEIQDGERDLVHRGGKSALGFRPLSATARDVQDGRVHHQPSYEQQQHRERERDREYGPDDVEEIIELNPDDTPDRMASPPGSGKRRKIGMKNKKKPSVQFDDDENEFFSAEKAWHNRDPLVEG